VLRAEAFVAGMREVYERDPSSLGPNPRANYEMGAAMRLLDSAWAQAEQTRILKRFQPAFERFDIILAPTTPVSPMPWTEPVTINGEVQENYYRWLALTYVTTLTTHPSMALPCGTDRAGLPFGLQVVGRFRADRHVLGVSHAMEQAFAAYDALRRPVPDASKLRHAQPALNSIVTAPPVLNAQVARGTASAV
jgi:amidase